jgi:uncharacterized damage-inducible protein DinB
MDSCAHFRTLARYNRIANERLYAACAQLSDEEFRKQRKGSFGSIHALLNHMLLGDRIWMSRFEGGGHTTPPLNTVLYDDFAALQTAREAEDARIEAFFTNAGADFDGRELRYTNSKGVAYVDRAGDAAAHFFNHQTHHRGQVHVMLAQTEVAPPSLDLHRIVNP